MIRQYLLLFICKEVDLEDIYCCCQLSSAYIRGLVYLLYRKSEKTSVMISERELICILDTVQIFEQPLL
jgi:hypothetical protein